MFINLTAQVHLFVHVAMCCISLFLIRNTRVVLFPHQCMCVGLPVHMCACMCACVCAFVSVCMCLCLSAGANLRTGLVKVSLSCTEGLHCSLYCELVSRRSAIFKGECSTMRAIARV